MDSVRTRFAWKAATPRRIPIASPTDNDACGSDSDSVVVDAPAWCIPRDQPWDGLALCGGASDAGAKGERGCKIDRSPCSRPRVSDCHCSSGSSFARHGGAAHNGSILCGGIPDWPGNLQLGEALAPTLGPHAGWLSRPDGLVLSYGLRSWRRANGSTCAA